MFTDMGSVSLDQYFQNALFDILGPFVGLKSAESLRTSNTYVNQNIQC